MVLGDPDEMMPWLLADQQLLGFRIHAGELQPAIPDEDRFLELGYDLLCFCVACVCVFEIFGGVVLNRNSLPLFTSERKTKWKKIVGSGWL